MRLCGVEGKKRLIFPLARNQQNVFQKSDKDSLEVMFYCEHHHWPKKDELVDYNQSDTIVHRGNGFIVYETDGYYEISFLKEIGGVIGS